MNFLKKKDFWTLIYAFRHSYVFICGSIPKYCILSCVHSCSPELRVVVIGSSFRGRSSSSDSSSISSSSKEVQARSFASAMANCSATPKKRRIVSNDPGVYTMTLIKQTAVQQNLFWHSDDVEVYSWCFCKCFTFTAVRKLMTAKHVAEFKSCREK